MSDPVSAAVVQGLYTAAISAAVNVAINALTPATKIEGPRLSDLKVQTTDYGQFIPRLYGTARLAGSLLWVEDNEIKEVKHTEEYGKGGPSVESTTYSYYASFAVRLTDCSAGPIAGVTKIWADSVLIYDITSDSPEALYASEELTDAIRIYTGTGTQEVDPLIQANQPYTPAYRYLSYIVFEKLQLEKFGNRIPNITAEVVCSDGSPSLQGSVAETYESSLSGITEPWPVSFNEGVLSIQQKSATDYLRQYDISANFLGNESTYYDQTPSGYYCILGDGYYKYDTGTGEINWYYTVGTNTGDLLAKAGIEGDALGAVASSNNKYLLIITKDPDGILSGAQFWYLVSVDGAGFPTIHSQGTCSGLESETVAATFNFSKSAKFGYNTFSASVMEDNLEYIWTVWGAGTGFVDLYQIIDGVLSKTGTVGYLTYHTFVYPCLHAENALCMIFQKGHMQVFSRQNLLTGVTQTLSDIVTAECELAGLSASEIDVTELTDEVDGFLVTNLTELRNNITPLQVAYLFDVLESEYKIKFLKRGGSSVITLTEDDLAAHEEGQERPQPLIETRRPETELPRQVKIRYLSADRDYDAGEQSATRLTTHSEKVISHDLPIVLTDNQAAQIAEIILYVAWAARNQYQFNLPFKYSYLEPTDIVTIALDSVTYRIRLTDVTAGKPGIVECLGEADRAALYSSSAVGMTLPASTNTIALTGPTNLQLLDIPMLRDADDDSGFYIAAGGYYAGWPGCAVFKSLDDGETYGQLSSIISGAVMGVSTDALADGETTVTDDVNTVNVQLYNSGTLSSITKLAMLNGSNVALLGSDGAWEVIKFQTATLESDGTYTLSNLIRGWRGTEHNTGGHAAGDIFILMAESTAIRTAANDDEIGLERYYKGVTFGKNIANATGLPFTNSAESLMPYSPCHILGSRDGSSNLTITWKRRTRVGGAWRDSVDASLGEDSEAYEVDIMDGSTVVRTLSSLTSETASYSAANQTTDFGSTQSSVEVNVYQISATVGRGHAGNAIV